jgi:hypothetical protein
MVGERDREQQESVRWEHLDDAAISIPPPFNLTYNGALQQHNRLHHQQNQYATMHPGGSGYVAPSEDTQSHWDDEQMGIMGDGMVGGIPTAEKGVRFPTASPTHGFSNGQLSQAPLQRTHSRYE